MNTIELLYQIFRARYSLDAVRQSLEKRYCLALIGSDELTERVRTWLGEPTLSAGGLQSVEPLRLPSPLEEGMGEVLQQVDAAVFHLGTEAPDEAWLRRQAELVPLGVPCLWVREAPPAEIPEQAPADPSLPRVHRVDPARAAELVPRLCLSTFPDLAIRLARDFSRVRLECARRMTARTAVRNAMVAAASSVTVSVPLVGQLLSLLAVTGETLVITASQLRLCLLMGALYGRPLDFFDRVDELWPVVGGAVGWRTVARQLVGFVPVAGPAAKAFIAYSGTWMVGESSRLFYELGERLPEDVRRQVEQEAHRRAREEAGSLVSRLREGGRAEEHGPDLWPEEGAATLRPRTKGVDGGKALREPSGGGDGPGEPRLGVEGRPAPSEPAPASDLPDGTHGSPPSGRPACGSPGAAARPILLDRPEDAGEPPLPGTTSVAEGPGQGDGPPPG